jgi:carbon-monoxide dehydrogenase small subunit
MVKMSKHKSSKVIIKLKINGEVYEIDIHVSDLLLNVLHNKLGLTRAKPGCLKGNSGAYIVIMN